MSYLTTPLVFFSVCAANICVTPTREIPSTSMIWSFTWILKKKIKIECKWNFKWCRLHLNNEHCFGSYMYMYMYKMALLTLLSIPTQPSQPISTPSSIQYLPSAAAAPPSVSDFTKIPSFSTPVSVPTPRPIMLNPSPLSSGRAVNTTNSSHYKFLISHIFAVPVPQENLLGCIDE